MKRTFPIAATFLVLGLASCALSYEDARSRDTAEAYRTFIRENPGDEDVPAARARLSELEFLEARRQHTLPAYKRFLTSFPNSPRARDAQLLVEGIRFEMASEKDTSEAWLAFLRDHPQGTHSQEARRRLEEADYRALSPSATSRDVRLFLGRHPNADQTRRRELERRLDELEFKESGDAGAKGLVAYLESNPTGAHRSEVKGEVLSREAMAMASVGHFDEARQKAIRIIDDAGRKRVTDEIDLMELDWIAARLDAAGLDAFIKRLEDLHDDTLPALPLARDRKALLAKAAPGAQALRESVDPLFFARPTGEMVSVLKSGDPRDRWRAALELGETAGYDVVKPLLDEVSSSRFSKVRTAAFGALEKIFKGLPSDLVDLTVQSQIAVLEKKAAQDSALFVRMGVLQELAGAPDKALVSYEKALRIAPGDSFALRRSVAINLQAGKPFRAGILARELAFRSRHQAEQWTDEEVEGTNALLVARTLCGVLDDAQSSLASLKGITPGAVADLSADLPAFVAMAEDAVAFTSARLGDAEANARAKDVRFSSCNQEDDLADRLEEGVKRRLLAVDAVAARTDALREIILKRMAVNDPSPRVRDAAAKVLAAGGNAVDSEAKDAPSKGTGTTDAMKAAGSAVRAAEGFVR